MYSMREKRIHFMGGPNLRTFTKIITYLRTFSPLVSA